MGWYGLGALEKSGIGPNTPIQQYPINLMLRRIPRCAGAIPALKSRQSMVGAPAMKHYLDFEKPIVEFQRKLEELKKHPEAHSLGISFEEEAAQIEKKIEETRRQIFSSLTPWQRVQLARLPKRPYTLDYLHMTFG